MCRLKIELCTWRAPALDVTTTEHSTVEGTYYLPPLPLRKKLLGYGDKVCLDSQSTFQNTIFW